MMYVVNFVQLLIKFIGLGPALMALELDSCDLQIFGDVYLSQKSISATTTNVQHPNIFTKTDSLLRSSKVNIVNFEGVASSHFDPKETKTYLLKMPTEAPKILRAAGIHVVTLANNHSMDFGDLGIRDTLDYLKNAGIQSIGAGINIDEASRPLTIQRSRDQINAGIHSYCLAAFSSTLPETFWASDSLSGTLYGSPKNIHKAMSQCKKQNAIIIAIFHWGQERQKEPHTLQKSLAVLAIDAGAHIVVGHHPHVIQAIEFYKNRPIIYSLGNYAFGSRPENSIPEGMGVRLKFDAPKNQLKLDLIPLVVRNDLVNFVPRTLEPSENDPVLQIIQKTSQSYPTQIWTKIDHPRGWSTLVDFSKE